MFEIQKLKYYKNNRAEQLRGQKMRRACRNYLVVLSRKEIDKDCKGKEEVLNQTLNENSLNSTNCKQILL